MIKQQILLFYTKSVKIWSIMVDKVDVFENLEKLGLNLAEMEIYYQLLYVEKLSVYELSKRVGMPRTTVYRICESLIKKGFVVSVTSSNGKEVKAVSLENLDFLVEEQKAKVEKIDNSIKALIDISKNLTKHVPKTEIRYYQGREGMRQLIWNTLRADKEIVGYSEFGRVAVVGEDFYDNYVKEFKLRKLKDRAITNEAGLGYVKEFVSPDKHQLSMENIRFLSNDVYYISGDHSIYNNIYSISYWKQGEIVGIEIENPELVKMHRSVFELMWGIASRISNF